MASTNININIHNPVRVISYNMHGFNQGQSTLKSLCADEYDIIFVQEHWLTPDKNNNVLCFSSNYTGFGISAMVNKVSSGIFYGRPHGGVSILVHNKFVKFVKDVSSDDRFVILLY